MEGELVMSEVYGAPSESIQEILKMQMQTRKRKDIGLEEPLGRVEGLPVEGTSGETS